MRDQIFEDEVEWDMDDPQNTAFSYAHAVCSDLGLGCDFATAVMIAVETQLAAALLVSAAAVLDFVLHPVHTHWRNSSR